MVQQTCWDTAQPLPHVQDAHFNLCPMLGTGLQNLGLSWEKMGWVVFKQFKGVVFTAEQSMYTFTSDQLRTFLQSFWLALDLLAHGLSAH